jgi:hypothetical protein
MQHIVTYIAVSPIRLSRWRVATGRSSVRQVKLHIGKLHQPHYAG